MVDYLIVRGGNKTYDRTAKKWRVTFEVQIGILFSGTKGKKCFWGDCDELKEAKDLQALFWYLDQALEEFIQIVIDPQSASSSIKFNDLVFAERDFKLESYNNTQYVKDLGMEQLTGVYSSLNISCFSDTKKVCCTFDEGTLLGLENQQKLVKEGSSSYNKIQKQIDNL